MLLKQIADISAGYPFRGSIKPVAGAQVKVVQMKNVALDGCIDWDSCVANEPKGNLAPHFLNEGDILIAARGTHNYAAIVSYDDVAQGLPAIAAPHFYVVRLADKKNNLPAYVCWLLNQSTVQKYYLQNSEGSITKSIRRSIVEDTPIAVPKLSKQQNIIALINTLTSEKKLAEQLIQSADEVMKAISQDIYKLKPTAK